MGDSGRVRVRSYRSVLDSVERRIFHLDRWRLPLPQGVSLRALVYTLAMGFGLLFASRLPLVDAVLSLPPPSTLYVGLPVLAGWALASLRIDGRPPHHVLRSAARHAAAPKTLAALRPCPAIGWTHAPIEAIRFAAVGDESVYRRGRVRGPATIVLRYPAEITVEGGDLESARRIRVAGLRGGRAMPVGKEIRVPAGAAVTFDG